MLPIAVVSESGLVSTSDKLVGHLYYTAQLPVLAVPICSSFKDTMCYARIGRLKLIRVTISRAYACVTFRAHYR